MVSEEEKNIFLQEFEEESLQEEQVLPPLKKKRKEISATAIFAAIFVFFLFIVVLLVFILGVSGSGSPVFKSFGIEAFEVKNFLTDLVNKVFMMFFIFLLLALAIGLFRGYSFSKEEKSKRKASFIFSLVAGSLIFLSVIAWQGTLAFVEHFVVDEGRLPEITMIGIENDEEIIAPIDIKFSAEGVVSQLRRQGYEEESFRWSQDGGATFTDTSFQDSTTFPFFTQGKQKIILQVTLQSGEVKEYTQKFDIADATFEVTPRQPTINKKVTLSAQRLVPNGKIFQWDFDNDGEYEKRTQSSSISYIFSRPGIQKVLLRVEKKDGSIEEFERAITVKIEAEKEIVADISPSENPIGKVPFEMVFDAGNSTTVDGEITKYLWEISPGNITKKGLSVNHTFEKEGDYLVTLTVENSFGSKDTTELAVKVSKGNSSPQAIITTKPGLEKGMKKFTENSPFIIDFSAEESIDPDDNITGYQWEIRNTKTSEVLETIEGDKNSYTFREEGEYTLLVTVTDSEGETDTKSIDIIVTRPPITPIVYATPQTGAIPLEVEFNASQSSCKLQDCDILSFEWNFNDGTPIIPSGAHISHEFTKTGTFDVEVTVVTNITGQKKSATVLQRITVTDPPLSACFEPSRSSGSAPVAVVFDPTVCSKGEIVRYEWDFGDSYVSEQRKPRHTYEEAGDYLVTLKVFDKNGRWEKHIETITVSSGFL